MKLLLSPGNPYWKWRLSTVHLLVLTNLHQLLLLSKHFTFYKTSCLNEEANCTVTSSSISIPCSIYQCSHGATKDVQRRSRSSLVQGDEITLLDRHGIGFNEVNRLSTLILFLCNKTVHSWPVPNRSNDATSSPSTKELLGALFTLAVSDFLLFLIEDSWECGGMGFYWFK